MSEKFFNRYRIPSARMQHWDYSWNAPYFITICTQHRTCYFGKIFNGEMILSELGKIALQCWIEIPLHFPHIHLGAFVVMPNHVHGVVIIDKPNDGRNDIFDKHSVTICEREIIENKKINDDGNNINGYATNNNEITINNNDGENIINNRKTIINNDGETIIINNRETIINNNRETIMVETGHALSLQATTSSQHNQLNNSIGKNRFQNIGKNSLSSIIGSYKSAVTKNARIIDPNFAWQTRFHEHIIRNHQSFVRIGQYIIENPAKWNNDQFMNR